MQGPAARINCEPEVGIALQSTQHFAKYWRGMLHLSLTDLMSKVMKSTGRLRRYDHHLGMFTKLSEQLKCTIKTRPTVRP